MRISSTDNSGQDPGTGTDVSWLVKCSSDRTLMARRQGDGEVELIKILEAGSISQAQAELMIAQELAGPGVVGYRDARVDHVTGRPCIVSDFHVGIDLQRWLDERGPLTPCSAVRIVAIVARTISRFHRAALPFAPQGMVHRDIKPSNVMLLGEAPDPITSDVLLIDLEHCCAANQATGERMTGGTLGYVPPEALLGATPGHGFDVYALGALLHALCTGEPPPLGDGGAHGAGRSRSLHVRVLPRALRQILTASLAADPAARPSAEVMANQLESLNTTRSDADARLDQVLRAIWAGALPEAESILIEQADRGDPARVADLAHLIRRRKRVISKCPDLRQVPDRQDPFQFATQIDRRAHGLAAWLQRFPNDAQARQHGLRLREALSSHLNQLPTQIAEMKRTAAFEPAESVLQATLSAVDVVERCLGALSPPAQSHSLPGLLHRDPQRYLRQALAEVRQAGARHSEMFERLQHGEACLQFNIAMRAVDDAASVYGGASEVVGNWKERLHRLQFLLEHAARSRSRINQLREQLEAERLPVDVTQLESLLARAAEQTTRESPARVSGSLRGLHRTLQELVQEFPQAAPNIDAARSALDAGMRALTGRAYELVDEARRKLAATPIPIRPLQHIINRLDSIRLLEAFVDLQQRPREQLLDEIERVRAAVEHARATRDRMAKGAQEAMERGHLTTAMYDIDRAVRRFGQDGDESGATTRELVAQLEEAKRVRQALAEAAKRNQFLANEYAQMQDDAKSEFDARVNVLEQRRSALEFMLRHLFEERAEPYVRDLRDVRLQIVTEHSEHAQAQFDHSFDPEQRLTIARDTLATLRELAAGSSHSEVSPGRAARIAQHWNQQLERASRDVAERQRAEQDRVGARRQRWLRSLAGVAVVIALAVGVRHFANASSRTPSDMARLELLRALQQPVSAELRAEVLHFDKVAACAQLSDFIALLAQAQLPDATREANRVLTLVQKVADRGPAFDLAAWREEMLAGLGTLDQQIAALYAAPGSGGHNMHEPLTRFGRQALAAAVWIAALSSSAQERTSLTALLDRSPARFAPVPSEALRQAVR